MKIKFQGNVVSSSTKEGVVVLEIKLKGKSSMGKDIPGVFGVSIPMTEMKDITFGKILTVYLSDDSEAAES